MKDYLKPIDEPLSPAAMRAYEEWARIELEKLERQAEEIRARLQFERDLVRRAASS